MTRFSPSQHVRIIGQSTDLFDAMTDALTRDQTDPTRIVRSIANLLLEHGIAGAAFAVRAWFDRVIEATPHAQIGVPCVAHFTNTDNTSLLARRQLTAEQAWVGDAIAARFSADQVRLYRLIESIPPDRRALLYLFRALETSAGIVLSYQNPPDGIQPGLYEPAGNGQFRHLGSPT